MNNPTIEQRIEQLLKLYQNPKFTDTGIVANKLNALLLALQDEQKEEMLSDLEGVVSKAQFDWEDAYYLIKEADYAYNPK